MSIVLARGDVVLTRFPFTDLSGSAVRPALVLSAGAIGQDFVLAGISSVLRSGTISTDLVIARRLGRIGPQLHIEVERRLRAVLGL